MEIHIITLAVRTVEPETVLRDIVQNLKHAGRDIVAADSRKASDYQPQDPFNSRNHRGRKNRYHGNPTTPRSNRRGDTPPQR